ncbi:hypothetical protein K4K53_001507 [Colletotrichum sp. SAR 10_77]|nr:hypothetical protein K4K51_011923 [Colletotrichum sp. SAR 10_75]KAI8247684.1 hypothetical protein K4K53_001507 [Colletotrichum sp. SAR 10_77]
MVTRKPAPDDTSVDTNTAPRLQDMRKELWSATTDSPSDVGSMWDDASQQKGAVALNQQPAHHDIPDSLKPGAGAAMNGAETTNGVWDDVNGARPQTADKPKDAVDVPLALRPGPPQGPPSRSDTNPFKRKDVRAGSEETTPPMPPAQPLSQVSTGEISNNPWQPALDQHALQREQKAVASTVQQPLRAQPSSDAEHDAWSASQDSRLPPISTSPALMSLPSEPASPAWDDLPENQSKLPAQPPPAPKEVMNEVTDEQHAWDDLGAQNKGKGKAPAPVAAAAVVEDGPIDDWNLVDAPAPAPAPPSKPVEAVTPKPQSNEKLIDTDEPEPAEKAPPALPPRNDEEHPPRQPPRPVDGKSETYQIKNINWFDHSAEKNPRTSPILVQNANGPCPLVALVNALTLTTPASVSDTALVQVLRSREQISLGYLLDAVFDELMSERRTHEDTSLPDVSELYGFLKGLHTGMNVNPRFIPTPEIVKAFKRTSLTHLHPTERDDLIPGTFEDTTEMALYAAFAIPLIHGWLPPKSDPAYGAFERQAASFEDVQTLLFLDEELQEKLGSLTEEEEQVYSDIQYIKAFLESSATQLTPCGLDVITKAMKPGSVAILFRNDHFSTLYRHPSTQQLLVLVTDAGYVSHDEIVWESLADVNGERTEYYSGDFRIVGGQQAQSTSRGPQIGSMQYLISWYGMGKTSVVSRLNIPGRVAWFLMEAPGFTTLLYIMFTLPGKVGVEDLPWQNKVLAGLFVIHYCYRAVLYPLIQPSMSPIHPAVAFSALGFQLCNATCIGGWLAAYGPTTPAAWERQLGAFGVAQFVAGIGLFYVGLVGNYFHDEELREIRRAEMRRQERIVKDQKAKGVEGKVSVDKHYRLPDALLFRSCQRRLDVFMASLYR